MARLLPGLLLVAFTIYAAVDCIQTEESRQRNLPKLAWVVLILLFPPIGGIVWFVAGRPRGPYAGRQGPRGPSAPRGPDDDPDFLRNL